MRPPARQAVRIWIAANDHDVASTRPSLDGSKERGDFARRPIEQRGLVAEGGLSFDARSVLGLPRHGGPTEFSNRHAGRRDGAGGSRTSSAARPVATEQSGASGSGRARYSLKLAMAVSPLFTETVLDFVVPAALQVTV